MRRNPGLIGSNVLPIVMVVMVAGIVGVSIPMVLGGGPLRGQGVVQVSVTASSSQTIAVFAENSGGYYGGSRQIGRSVRFVTQFDACRSYCYPLCICDAHGHLAGLGAAAECGGAFGGCDRSCRGAAGRNSITYAFCRPVNPDCVLDRCSCAAERNAVSYKHVITHGNHYFSFRRDSCVTSKAHSSPRRLPSTKPQSTPTAESQPVMATGLVSPKLVGPAPDSRISGVAVFEWRPAIPLASGMAYEVVVWSPEQDPSQAWGIAPPTRAGRWRSTSTSCWRAGGFGKAACIGRSWWFSGSRTLG